MIGLLVPTRFEGVGLLKCLANLKCIKDKSVCAYLGRYMGQPIMMVIISVGKRSAKIVSQFLERYKFERLVLAGFAGGLDPRLQRGTVIFASAENYQNLIYCSGVPIAKVVDKQNCFQQTACKIVDMESSCIAELARKHQMPLTMVRVVSDDAHEELPMDALSHGYDLEKGSYTPLKMMKYLMRNPTSIWKVLNYVRAIKPVQKILTEAVLQAIRQNLNSKP